MARDVVMQERARREQDRVDGEDRQQPGTSPPRHSRCHWRFPQRSLSSAAEAGFTPAEVLDDGKGRSEDAND
jgi:hypothetical protein